VSLKLVPNRIQFKVSLKVSVSFETSKKESLRISKTSSISFEAIFILITFFKSFRQKETKLVFSRFMSKRNPAKSWIVLYALRSKESSKIII
jgi:hypothetical protein